jgi:hypothetical protein
MEQVEPKENQLPETETEQGTRTDVPEPEGTLLGYDDLPSEVEPPCPCPCPCNEE